MQEIEANKICNDLLKLKLYPKKIFADGKAVSFKSRQSILELELTRPFIVIEAIGKNYNNEKVIYKREWGKTSLIEDIHKEAIIYRNILPQVYKFLPADIKEKVIFPKIYDEVKEGGKIKAIIRESIDGVVCGSRYADKKDIWNVDDIKIIAIVIKAFQSIDPEEIRKSGLKEIPQMDFLKLYKELFDKQEEAVKKMLGIGYAEKMRELYMEYEKIIPKQKSIILSEEVFGYNIIKTPDGRLGFIDWERPYIGQDLSSDYGKFISRLWVNPALYKKAVGIVLKLNKENPDFRNLLRATLVSHSFDYFYKMTASKKKAERKEALKAVKFFKKSFKEILDEAGIWALKG